MFVFPYLQKEVGIIGWIACRVNPRELQGESQLWFLSKWNFLSWLEGAENDQQPQLVILTLMNPMNLQKCQLK